MKVERATTHPDSEPSTRTVRLRNCCKPKTDILKQMRNHAVPLVGMKSARTLVLRAEHGLDAIFIASLSSCRPKTRQLRPNCRFARPPGRSDPAKDHHAYQAVVAESIQETKLERDVLGAEAILESSSVV